MPCRLARHEREQVAVACCDTSTGCPRIGVCRPSFAGSAGASRFAMKSRAWDRTTSIPRSLRYPRSLKLSLKRERNADRASLSNTLSRSRIAPADSLWFANQFRSTVLNSDSVKPVFAPQAYPRVLAQDRSCLFRLNPTGRTGIAPQRKRKGQRIRSAGPSFLLVLCRQLAALPHEAEQEQEHVDEVEVEVERADDGRLRHGLAIPGNREIDALDLLRVVHHQSGENQNTDRADAEVQGR